MSQTELMARRREQEPSAFIRRKLAEGAARFELFALGVDGSRTFCDAWPASLGFDELRDSIEDKSARVAAMGSTVSNFCVMAQGPRSDAGAAEQLGLECFRVSHEIARTSGAMLSEPANEAGLLAQLMRHNETNLKTTFGLQGVLFAQQAETIAEQRRQLGIHDERRLSTFQLLEDLISSRAARELEEKKAAHTMELKAKVAESLTKLLPIATDAVMGKLLPQGAALTSAHLARELFNNIRQDQYQKILQQLDPEQGMQVVRLLRSLKEQEDQAEVKKGGADGTEDNNPTKH
jgi:hypothetical protein